MTTFQKVRFFASFFGMGRGVAGVVELPINAVQVSSHFTPSSPVVGSFLALSLSLLLFHTCHTMPGYNPEEEIAFSSGMGGSQAMLDGGDRGGPQLPGLENLGADAVVAGGITVDPNIPAGMEFIPSSVPDGEVAFTVASSGQGGTHEIAVSSPCMTFEDYYAAFSPGSHPSLSVTPSAGRMDRRSGEPTIMQILCQPNGQGGTFTGDLVINLPDDNSKICYKVSVNSL